MLQNRLYGPDGYVSLADYSSIERTRPVTSCGLVVLMMVRAGLRMVMSIYCNVTRSVLLRQAADYR